MNLRVIEARDYQDMSRKAAGILAAQVVLRPDSVLGLATGSSPVGVYRQLAEWHRQGDLDFSEITTVNLDEYKGLTPEHAQSYRHFMQENLFDHINIRPECTHLPDGMAVDPEAECRRYDEAIARCGGIDVQLLGIGLNGHIGFNEPGDTFENGTHVVALSESTIAANARFFSSAAEVPRHALTMGIGSIMSARHILLIVSGREKAEIIGRAFRGPVTPRVPASVLQLHNHVTLIGDADALSAL